MTTKRAEGSRVLRILFSEHRLPQEVTAGVHAAERAAFADGKTKK